MLDPVYLGVMAASLAEAPNVTMRRPRGASPAAVMPRPQNLNAAANSHRLLMTPGRGGSAEEQRMHDTTLPPMPPRPSFGARMRRNARNVARELRRISREARQHRGWCPRWAHALWALVVRLCWRASAFLLVAGLLTCIAGLLAPESCAPAAEVRGVNVPQTFAAARLHAVAAAAPASRLLRERGLDAERFGDIVVPAVAHACERATPWLLLGSQRGGELLDELRAIAMECGLPAASRAVAAVRKAFAPTPRAGESARAPPEEPSEAPTAATATFKEPHGARSTQSSSLVSEKPSHEADEPSVPLETA